MKINEIEIGKVYLMKHHAGNMIRVQIIGTSRHNVYGSYPGSWNTVAAVRTRYRGINLETGREIVVKSAAKLRQEVVS